MGETHPPTPKIVVEDEEELEEESNDSKGDNPYLLDLPIRSKSMALKSEINL